MDPKLFKEKIKPLGDLVRACCGHDNENWQDTVFRVKPRSTPCPNCFDHGRDLVYQIKYDRKFKPHWWTKCRGCGQNFRGFHR